MRHADLTSPSHLKQLLQSHGFRIKKRLGQNFLVDRNVLNKILEATALCAGDNVLEIGPGVGTVTTALAEAGAKVVAVEVDQALVSILSEVLCGFDNVVVIHSDILALDLPRFLQESFGNAKVKVVGNLPYYITTPVITKLIEARSQLERIVLMVQKEFAERMTSQPGTKEYGSMTVFVQFYVSVEIVAYVSKNVFFPPPDVSSAIVRLTPRAKPPVEVPSEQAFFDVVHCAFGQRRKTLLNSLSDCPALGLSKAEIASILRKASIESSRRPETLSLEEFARITWSLAAQS